MGFINKIKQFATGKTELERKQEKAATEVIKKEVMSAQLRQRREEAIKFAIEAEKYKYSERLKRLRQLRQPRQSFGGFGVVAPEYRNYGSVTGAPRIVKTKVIKRTVGKGKKRRKVKRTIRTSPKYSFNQIAGGNTGYRVI